MRITYDPEVDAAYIYLTDEALAVGRDSILCDLPEGIFGIVVLDWKDGKIAGLEVLDARDRLHADMLSQAGPPGMAPMAADPPTYQDDTEVLTEIGRSLTQASMPRIEVRLPRHLAQRAVAAWERTGDAGEKVTESDRQRVLRHNAGTLALIGLAIRQDGRWDGDDVVAAIDPGLIGMAIAAADDQT